jgi:hypothetical protein
MPFYCKNTFNSIIQKIIKSYLKIKWVAIPSVHVYPMFGRNFAKGYTEKIF